MSSIATKNERWTPVKINVESTSIHSRTNINDSNAMPIRSSDCSDQLRQILIKQDFRSAGILVSSQHNLRIPYRKPSATNLTNVSPVRRNGSMDSCMSSMSSFGSISEPQDASHTAEKSKDTSNSRWKSIPSKTHGNDKPIGMVTRKSSTYLFSGALSA